MQFEDFDKRIKDAADNHHPSYDEKAWTKMENLLDKHLPTEKKRRKRIFFILLAFLLLGGGAYLLIDKPWKQTSEISDNKPTIENDKAGRTDGDGSATIDKNTPTDGPVTAPALPGTDQQKADDPLAPVDDITGKNTGNPDQKRGTEPGTVSSRISGAKKAARKTVIAGDDRAIVTTNQANKNRRSESIAIAAVPSERSDNTVNTSKQNIDSVSTVKNPAKPDLKTTEPATKTAESIAAVAPQEPVATKEDTKNKREKKRSSSLAVTASAGPDISAVGLRGMGKVSPVYGFGMAYTIQRFTIRAGFFKASKIYTAKSTDYKFETPPPNIRYLDKIEADCKVIEIPVSVAYRFGQAKNHHWFGAAGLSSYIMKEEKYDYVYKYPNGQTYTHPWNHYNENNHIFSVLSLSGGYTRKLNKTFSVSAEPYLKLPLTGIGAGKLQLNSAGVLITISAKLLGDKK